jgi:hypothetical protein
VSSFTGGVAARPCVCFGLEEAVWFKWDCRWTSGGQSILENGGPCGTG